MASSQQVLHGEQWLRQGIVAAKAGQHREARKLLKQATRLDPQNVTAWLWLSGVLQDPLEQESALEKVLQLEPDHVAAHKGLLVARGRVVTQLLSAGQEALRSGDPARARELFSQVVARDEEQLEAWVGLSRVVDTSEDQQVCFENILALDPENVEAQRSLDLLMRSMEAVNESLWFTTPPEESEGNFGRDAASLAGEVLGKDDVERYSSDHPDLSVDSGASVLHLWEKFEDEYVCPYCGQPTDPDAQHCSACERQLWMNVYKRERPSSIWWSALVAKVILTLIAGGVFVYLIAAFNFTEDLSALYSSFALRDPATGSPVTELETARLLQTVAIVAGLYCATSLAGTVAFFLRWTPMYYWMLAMAGLAILCILVSWIPGLADAFSCALAGITTLLFVVISLFFPAVYFYAITTLEPDFIKSRMRILTRLDRDAKDGMTCFLRGRLYASREMWVLAMVHLRRAASMMHAQVDPYLALSTACIQLGECEMAKFYLNEARGVNPQAEHIARVEKILAQRMATAA